MENLLDFINEIKDAKCDNYQELENKLKSDYYVYKSLKNIEKKNQSIKRNGVIIFSKETYENSTFENYYKEYNNSEKYLFRYYYFEKLNNDGEHITIVMLNPAFADSENSDSTIDNIKLYLTNLDIKIKSFDIINLYAIRMPKSVSLKVLVNELDKENYIDSYCDFVGSYLDKSSDLILCAWGNEGHKSLVNCPKGKGLSKITEVLKDKKCYCYKQTNEDAPRHFSPCSFNGIKNKIKDALGKYNLLEYSFN